MQYFYCLPAVLLNISKPKDCFLEVNVAASRGRQSSVTVIFKGIEILKCFFLISIIVIFIIIRNAILGEKKPHNNNNNNKNIFSGFTSAAVTASETQAQRLLG